MYSSDRFVDLSPNSVDALLKATSYHKLPAVDVKKKLREKYRIRWCDNLAHYLVKKYELTASELILQSINSRAMDFISSFKIPEGQYANYMDMIGNRPELTTWSGKLPAAEIVLPMIGFSFAQDWSKAFLICTLQANEIRINMQLVEDLSELLRLQVKDGDEWFDEKPDKIKDIVEFKSAKGSETTIPELHTKVALLTDEEKDYHKSSVQNIPIDNYVTQNSNPSNSNLHKVDGHFNHPCRCLFIAAINKKAETFHNYGNATDDYSDERYGETPIKSTSLHYESNAKYQDVPSIMFEKVEPFYHSIRSPSPYKKGHLLICNCLDINSLDSNLMTDLSMLTPIFQFRLSDNDKKDDDKRDLADPYYVTVVALTSQLANIRNSCISFKYQ